MFPMIPPRMMVCNSAPSNYSSLPIFTRCSLMIPPQMMVSNSAPSNSTSSSIFTRCSRWYLLGWWFVTQHQAIPVAFLFSPDAPWWYLLRWWLVTQHQTIPVTLQSSPDVPWWYLLGWWFVTHHLAIPVALQSSPDVRDALQLMLTNPAYLDIECRTIFFLRCRWVL